jgi:hypothetical protein
LNGDALKVPKPADFSIVPPAGAAKVTAYDAHAKTVTIQATATIQSVSVRYRAKPVPDRNILADVELHYNKSMRELGRDDAFEIRFKARAGRWAYYLITDQTGDFSIVDSSASGPPLGFSATNRTLLNAVRDEPDPFATALSRQYPNFQRIRFLSDQPVPCSSAAKKGIELRLGGQTVLEAMPIPRPGIFPESNKRSEQTCKTKIVSPCRQIPESPIEFNQGKTHTMATYRHAGVGRPDPGGE